MTTLASNVPLDKALSNSIERVWVQPPMHVVVVSQTESRTRNANAKPVHEAASYSRGEWMQLR